LRFIGWLIFPRHHHCRWQAVAFPSPAFAQIDSFALLIWTTFPGEGFPNPSTGHGLDGMPFGAALGTRLNEAGVDDKEIQSILRHADVSTTQAFYILPNRERAEAGLKKLDKTLRRKYGIKA